MTNLGKSTIYLFIAQAIYILTGQGIHFFLGRYLGPENYGVYGVILTLMMTINLLLITGIPTAVSKFISEDIKNANYIKNKALKLQFLISLIIAFFYFLSADFISFLLKDPSLVNYIKLSALIFPTYSVFAIYIYYFNGLQQFYRQSILNILYSIFRLALIIPLVLMFKIKGAILAFIFTPLFTLIFATLFKKCDYEKREIKDIYGKLIRFAFPVVIFSVFLNILINIDLWFVKFFLTNFETGLYTASSSLSKMVYLGIIVIGAIIFPAISSSFALKDMERTKSLINHSLRYLLIILLPLITYIIIRSNKIILIAYGFEYYSAWQSLSILILGIGFLTLFFIFTTIINAIGTPNKSMYLVILGLLISIILNYLLIPIYGLNGAAIATTITGLIILFISGIMINNKFGLGLKAKFILNIILPLFISCLIIPIFSFISSNEFMIIPESFLFFGFYFLLLTFVFKEITLDDIRRLQRSIPFSNKFKFLFNFLEGKI